MREVGRAAGWTIFELDGRYYVRIEEVVSYLANGSAAREVLAAVLSDDLDDDAAV